MVLNQTYHLHSTQRIEFFADVFLLRVNLEGFCVVFRCLLAVSMLEVGVSKMIVDDRIVYFELCRLLEKAHRFGVVPLFVVRPPKTVYDIAGVGSQNESFSDELDRLVELHLLLGVHVSEIIVHVRVIGVQLDGL